MKTTALTSLIRFSPKWRSCSTTVKAAKPSGMKLQGQSHPVALCPHVRTENCHLVRGPIIKLRRHVDGQGNGVRSQIAYVSAIVAEMIIFI